MRVAGHDGCGCFPTGRHYPGIAHLLAGAATRRGLVDGFEIDAAWRDLPIAMIDTETTGRDASSGRIVEIGIVVGLSGVVTARHNWLVNPGMPIPEEARAVHGISDDKVKDSPRFEEIADEVARILVGVVPAAYNAAFDKSFLANEFARAGKAGVPKDIEWIDPLIWARAVQHEERSRTLGDVAARLGIALENAHRAIDDAEAALRVLYALSEDVLVPKQYRPLILEQRRLGLAQADERRFWR